MTESRAFLLITVAGFWFAAATPAYAMGTTFSYQGSLEDGGNPANGHYDFEFRLLNSGLLPLGVNLLDDVEVAQGVFTVQLDFGAVSNAFPGEFTRFLEIGIRPAGSAGAYEYLAPVTPINPAPYAQRAAQVTDGAVVSTSLGTNAVTESKITASAVTTAKLANNAVSSDKLANNAVTNAKLANNAVTNAKVAAGTLTMSRHAGAFTTGVIGSLFVGGNACISFDFNIAGAQAGDIPFVALQAGEVLPSNMSLSALRVPSNGTLQLRACNSGTTLQGWNTLNVIFMTLR